MRLWVGNEHWISKSVIFSLSLGTADDYLFMDAPGRLEVFCHFHTRLPYDPPLRAVSTRFRRTMAGLFENWKTLTQTVESLLR